jgi:hypothetical protein
VYDRHRYETANKTVMEAVAARIMALIESESADNIVPFAR